MNMKYYIKVKNILGKNKVITLLNGDKYTLKNKDERPIIFELLKTGFEVSKILEENIRDYMKIETILESTKTSSNDKKEIVNETNNVNEEKPKKKRGRPPKIK